jgi:RimJ/RimL family protein N-acetyltransferase
VTIYIEKYTESDIAALYQVISDSADHLRPWMPWLHGDYAINDTKLWVEKCIEDWNQSDAYRYLVKVKQSGEIVGAVGLERIVPAHKIAELGYWVAAKATNSGVATAAGRLAIYQAFKVHGINRIEINVLTDNVSSNKVAVKLGGLLEGTLRNKLFHNGASHAAHSYSIIPGDYDI